MIDSKAVTAELDQLIAECRALRQRSQYDDLSDLPDAEAMSMATSLAAAIRRLSPPRSQYVESLDGTLKSYGHTNTSAIPTILGILTALRNDVAGGRTKSAVEIIHADLFSDFLEMADHLVGEGFKDPAAVLAGGVLEGHLHNLATKHSISLNDSKGAPKKADLLNAELAGANVYSKGDQKNITAWLHLRNPAAHGKYSEYTIDQVKLLIQSIRDLIARIPA